MKKLILFLLMLSLLLVSACTIGPGEESSESESIVESESAPESESEPEPEPEPVKLFSYGIDVSEWNNVKDWNAVKNSGVEFVVIRVGGRGYGFATPNIYADKKAAAYFKGAKEAGLKLGIYFYASSITEEEAIEEANYCLSFLDGAKLDFPVFYDIEYSGPAREKRADNLDAETKTKNALAFCKEIEANGYKAGVYSSQAHWSESLIMEQLTDYCIWVAQYSSMVEFLNLATNPNEECLIDICQYSCTGSCPGISGNVDMNLSYQ